MTRFDLAIAAIDELNALDPRRIEADGTIDGQELVYGRRMSRALDGLYPEASELLRLAARAQHVQRWLTPRQDFPAGKAGYHRWRNTLKRMHGEITAGVMRRSGYGDDEIACVRSMIEKRNLEKDGNAQALEDVACIVFLVHYADAFAERHDEEKSVDILRKTWAKMSPHGKAAALALQLTPRMTQLLSLALGRRATE